MNRRLSAAGVCTIVLLPLMYSSTNPTRPPVSIFRKRKELANKDSIITLTSAENEFLRMACTELSYGQIQFEMNIFKHIGDAYIDSLFKKFAVDCRAGLVLEYISGGKTRVQTAAADNLLLIVDQINRLLR